MLEHGSESQDSPDAPAASAPSQAFYIPPGKPEPLTGGGASPSVKRFSRKMLLLAALVAAIVVSLALIVGLQAPKKGTAVRADANAQGATTNETLNALPGSYADGATVLKEPHPGDLPPLKIGHAAGPHQLSALEQWAQQQTLEALKREETARSAGVTFAGASAASAAVSSGEPNALQQKLLELAQQRDGGRSEPLGSAYAEEDPSGQGAKSRFLGKTHATDFDLQEHLLSPRSPYTLFAGTVLPCVLTQGINSDLPGQIGCLISQNVFDTVTGYHLLIPQGTKALGVYDSHVAYGQNRVLIVWTRLLRPDGSTLSLEGMPGTDMSGYAGLSGHVNNHYLRLLSGVVLGSLIGASAQIAVGANSQNPSFAALAAQGAGQNINEAGQQITRRNLNIPPTIEVRPGARLNIVATKDLILPPWVP